MGTLDIHNIQDILDSNMMDRSNLRTDTMGANMDNTAGTCVDKSADNIPAFRSTFTLY